MSNKQPMTCPYCNSRNIAKYLYGMPVFSEKLEKQLTEGKVILGGCMIETDAPTFHCNNCKKEWNSENVKKKLSKINLITSNELISITLN